MSRPLRTVTQKCGADSLLVLLPGAYMTPEDYAEHFFPGVVERQLTVDLMAVDLDLEAITGGQAIPAVLDQIIRPARDRYRRIWLGGISLGGLLTLCLNADHPGTVDGLCLIAPYPGSRLTTNAITRAGGLAVWEPTPTELRDPEFRMYRWLKAPSADLPVFVGYGRDDRFAEGMQGIAECFPSAARQVVAGNHDWPAWRALWEHFLARGHFAQYAR